MTLPRKQQHMSDRPTREVFDGYGRSWVIGEVSTWRPDGSCDIALVAEDGDLLRRFSDFPANWVQLSEAALVRLVDGPRSPPQQRGGTAREGADEGARRTD